MDGKNLAVIASRFKHPYFLAGIIPAIFFLLFYFYPLSGILVKSFSGDANSFLPAVRQFTGSKRMLSILWFTFWQAGISTLLTLSFAVPVSFVFSNFKFRGKRLFMVLASIPFVLPAVVVATALQTCFGKSAALGIRIDSPLILIFIAHIFYNFSVMLRIITSHWTALQGRISEASATLGATPLQTFRFVTLPLLAPSILAACTLVFIFCFSSFGIILILGGPGYSTLETEIYRQAAHLFNLPLASLLSLLQIVFTFILMWGYTRYTQKTARFVPDFHSHASGVLPKTVFEKTLVFISLLFILVLCTLPMLALILKSFLFNGKPSLAYYLALFENPVDSIFYVPPVKAIFYSVLFAGCALFIALLTGTCAALFIRYCHQHFPKTWGAFFDPVFMLPLSTSAVTLGFGIIITLDKPPLNLRTSFFLVPIAHALVGFPFVIRTILPALRAIPDSLPDAGTALGASRLKAFIHIELPLIIKPVIAAAIFAFTISLGEFGATIFTARPDTPTIPLAIYRFLGQPGAMNFGQAMAVATILMVVTAVSYIGIEYFRPEKNEGF